MPNAQTPQELARRISVWRAQYIASGDRDALAQYAKASREYRELTGNPHPQGRED